MYGNASEDFEGSSVKLTRYGDRNKFSVDSELYQKFKDKPNFQAFADNQVGRLIKEQQRGHNTNFFGGEEPPKVKPSNLYQEYLKKAGMMRDKPKSVKSENNKEILKMTETSIINHMNPLFLIGPTNMKQIQESQVKM